MSHLFSGAVLQRIQPKRSAMSAQTTKNDFMLSAADLATVLNMEVSELFLSIDKLGLKNSSKTHLFPKVVRSLLNSRGFVYPHKIVSFQMLKGGVAKTTSALNFGIRAAQYGAKVLFVDLDQQANLSFALGVEAEENPVWVDIVEKKTSIEEAILPIDEGIDLVPSNLNNSVLDRVLLNSHRNWSQAVLAPLKAVRAHYDLVVIDTAPHLSATNSAVTCASDIIVLPINPDKFSLLGLEKHLEDLKDLKGEFALSFETRLLLTRFDAREKVSHEILAHCQKNYDEILMKSLIRTSTEIKNTIHQGKSIYAAKSVAKQDYDAMTREMLDII